MKTTVIRQRVADFLKQHAPFDALPEQDLLELAGSGRVKFHTCEEFVFRQRNPKGQFVWMIQQGRVELLDENASGERLCDVLGEGDLLGLERFVGDGSCLYSARTATDVILYGLDASLFESSVARHPGLRRFLSARFSVSGSPGFQRTSWLDAEAPPVEFLRGRLVVLPRDASTKDAAFGVIHSRNGVAALVNEGGHPIGTITPLDLCKVSAEAGEVAAGRCPPCVAAPLSTRAAVREMLQSRGEQLAITGDGTRDSPLEAVLTAADLALFCGHDPVRLINAIRRASSAAEIVPLLRPAIRLAREAMAQPHDIDDCCRIGGEVVAAVADACIRLVGDDLEAAGFTAPRVPCCWVMFGASARGDLPEPELPSIAAVYDETDEAFRPEDSIYFAALAGETLARFHACGLSGPGLYWPEGARPSMPLSEWTRLYSETIRNPLGHDLYARRSFLDMWPLSGDVSILRTLQDHILLELRDHETAIPLLANDTMAHLPPLTLFRGLVLELDGMERNSFDVADVVLSPLTDAARVFAIAERRLNPANTLERLETARLAFPDNAAIFREAGDAFRVGLYYRTLAGSNRIEPGRLGKFDQLLLKTAFSSIHRFLEFTVSMLVRAT